MADSQRAAPGGRLRAAVRSVLLMPLLTVLFTVLFTVLITGLLAGPASAIERRQEQFPDEFSYLIVPLPYSLPGIGEGLFVPLYFSNLAETTTDAYALLIVGDATGQIYGLEEVPILPRVLFFNAFYLDLDRAVVNNYATRGMDSRQDDYSLSDLSQVEIFDVGLTLSFLDRRLELGYYLGGQATRVDRLLDKDGNLIQTLNPPYTTESRSRKAFVFVDYTDDYQDPRIGLRFSGTWSDSPRTSADNPDFYTRDLALTGYVPVGAQSTLALHFFRSDAFVRQAGETDLATLKAGLGLNCGADPVCLAREDELARSIRDGNRNGTATSLGGEDRLRAYPAGRFQGAHTLYYAAEFRWNLTQEVTPFDYFIWKDVRTGVQLAFFYETGSVSETAETLGDRTRSDVGVGVRLVAGSGSVYRADVASGDEGTEVTVIVNYPF